MGWRSTTSFLSNSSRRTARSCTRTRSITPTSSGAFEAAAENFGVATSLEYRLYPVGPTVTGGLIAYPFDQARDMLRFFRDRTASLPDEQTLFAGLIHAPDGSGTKLAAMVTCHCGSLEDGEVAMRPLKESGSPA